MIKRHNTAEIRRFFESLSPEQVEELNRKNDEEHQQQADAFRKAYAEDACYLCGKPFKTISTKEPCLHWLLRQCKFKKKDFPKVYSKYSYTNMAAFLRWCANQERLLGNINDLADEKPERKVFCFTVRWKNIEWTFDCSESDFAGHGGTKSNFPHYHFQMRVDGRPFIDFGNFHIPFTDEDMFHLQLIREQGDWFKHGFGAIGSGMQEAMEIDPELALQHMQNADEADATYHLSTMIEAIDKPIPGELLEEIQAESQATGRSMSQLAKERLEGIATVSTVITPADTVPDIASRTERKRR